MREGENMFIIVYSLNSSGRNRKKVTSEDFTGGTVDRSSPANAGNMGGMPGLGRSRASTCAITTEPVL